MSVFLWIVGIWSRMYMPGSLNRMATLALELHKTYSDTLCNCRKLKVIKKVLVAGTEQLYWCPVYVLLCVRLRLVKHCSRGGIYYSNTETLVHMSKSRLRHFQRKWDESKSALLTQMLWCYNSWCGNQQANIYYMYSTKVQRSFEIRGNS